MTAVTSHASATEKTSSSSRSRASDRGARGSRMPAITRQQVADAANGSDQLGRELAPQVVHVNLDRVALDLFAPGIEAFLELLPREHAAGVEQQFLEQIEFLRLELDRLAAVGDRSCR